MNRGISDDVAGGIKYKIVECLFSVNWIYEAFSS